MPAALATDLYELTMAAGYFHAGRTEPASFELSVRGLPPDRGYLVAAGLEPALEHLEQLRFTASEIEYLRSQPALQGAPGPFFDDYLPRFRFTGDVWAMPEGAPVFPQEPLLRVTAPLIEAQVVETALLATVLFQTSVASRAARVTQAAAGRPVFEFGARRAHGTGAGRLAARAACIGGCDATSDVEAGLSFGLPLAGTMAHSWVMSHRSETEAFVRFTDLYGRRAVLLIDTYDSARAVRRIAEARLEPGAVRIDSGDLAAESRTVRAALDAAGLRETRIFASGDLDEHRIAALVDERAPIDGFGVGTALSTVSDAPALGGVYKLVEMERDGEAHAVLKLSREKRTWPGIKQVWRVAEGGRTAFDVVACLGETPPSGAAPLLEEVLREGRRVRGAPSIDTLRQRARREIALLPGEVRRLRSPEPYRVVISDALARLAEDIGHRIRAGGDEQSGSEADTHT